MVYVLPQVTAAGQIFDYVFGKVSNIERKNCGVVFKEAALNNS